MRPDTISLRPGEWGDRSLKVKVLAAASGWVALDQPLVPPDWLNPPGTASERLQNSLRERSVEGTKGWEAFLGQSPSAIYHLPCSGPVLFGTNRETYSILREEYGSNLWCFRFYLLSRGGPDSEHIACDLPVAVHNTEPGSLISHTTGKKASTIFRKLRKKNDLELWEAQTRFLRPDQIRLHAAEVGIRVAGESYYGDFPPLSRADLPGTRRPGGRGYVLLPGPAIHLAQISIPSLSDQSIRSTPPKVMDKWIRWQLGEEKDLQGPPDSL